MKLYAIRNIGGSDYKVYAAQAELSGDGGQVLDGIFVPEKHLIVFNGASKDRLYALLHEEFHAVLQENAFGQVLEFQAEEILIEQLLAHVKKFYIVYPKKKLLK